MQKPQPPLVSTLMDFQMEPRPEMLCYPRHQNSNQLAAGAPEDVKFEHYRTEVFQEEPHSDGCC